MGFGLAANFESEVQQDFLFHTEIAVCFSSGARLLLLVAGAEERRVHLVTQRMMREERRQ